MFFIAWWWFAACDIFKQFEWSKNKNNFIFCHPTPNLSVDQEILDCAFAFGKQSATWIDQNSHSNLGGLKNKYLNSSGCPMYCPENFPTKCAKNIKEYKPNSSTFAKQFDLSQQLHEIFWFLQTLQQNHGNRGDHHHHKVPRPWHEEKKPWPPNQLSHPENPKCLGLFFFHTYINEWITPCTVSNQTISFTTTRTGSGAEYCTSKSWSGVVEVNLASRSIMNVEKFGRGHEIHMWKSRFICIGWNIYIFFYDLFSWPKTHGDSNIARRTIRLQGHQLPSCHLQMQASFNIFSWIIHKKKREKSLNHVVCLGHAKPWPKKKLYVAKALYNIRPQRAGLPHAAMASELAATTNNKMNMSQCHYSWRRP